MAIGFNLKHGHSSIAQAIVVLFNERKLCCRQEGRPLERIRILMHLSQTSCHSIFRRAQKSFGVEALEWQDSLTHYLSKKPSNMGVKSSTVAMGMSPGQRWTEEFHVHIRRQKNRWRRCICVETTCSTSWCRSFTWFSSLLGDLGVSAPEIPPTDRFFGHVFCCCRAKTCLPNPGFEGVLLLW